MKPLKSIHIIAILTLFNLPCVWAAEEFSDPLARYKSLKLVGRPIVHTGHIELRSAEKTIGTLNYSRVAGKITGIIENITSPISKKRPPNKKMIPKIYAQLLITEAVKRLKSQKCTVIVAKLPHARGSVEDWLTIYQACNFKIVHRFSSGMTSVSLSLPESSDEESSSDDSDPEYLETTEDCLNAETHLNKKLYGCHIQ